VGTETRIDGGGLAAAKVERGPASAHVTLRVNGTERLVDLEPRTSLLDALREHLELTGSKRDATREPVALAPSGLTGGVSWHV